MFAAIGRFSYRFRWWVLAVWAATFVVALVASTHVAGELKGGGFSNSQAPAQQALRLMQRRLDTGLSQLVVVFTSDTLTARSAAFQQLEAEALAGLKPRTVPGLMRVQTYANSGGSLFISKDGKASLAVLVFKVPMDTVQEEIPDIRAAVRHTQLKTYVSGDAAVYADMERVSASDLRKAEAYTIPVALLVLLLVFGTLVAAALPVVGGGMAVTVTLGVVYVIAHFVDVSIFALNTTTLLGLAVGIDYALFMVGRFREELREGATVAAAVETTVARAGRSIFFSGLAVIVGMLGLLTFKYMALRSIGLGGSLVVLFSVAAALTLLPALMGILGPRVNSVRVFGRAGHEGRFWRRWSDWVMVHPVSVLIVTVAVVLAFAWPVVKIHVDVPSAASLPTNTESRQGYDIIQHRFDSSALSPVDVLVTWGEETSFTSRLDELYAFGRELQGLPDVGAVTSVATIPRLDSPALLDKFWQIVLTPRALHINPGGPLRTNPGDAIAVAIERELTPQQRRAALQLAQATSAPGTALFKVASTWPPDSQQAQKVAARIRDFTPPAGMQVHVAGLSAGIHDYVHDLYARFPWIIVVVVVVTYLVLLMLLHSVLLPLKAVIVNTLSLLASFGAVVWVFQFGHLEWLLHFHSIGTVDADLPVVLFCTVFGVSMDYEVFLLSRMREAWEETHDNQTAVSFGLTSTGRIVTSAALIIVVVAGSFAFTSIIITKAIGVGLAVAVALDASIVRILMVPAIMRLLGRLNWWCPRWLDRWLPRLGE